MCIVSRHLIHILSLRRCHLPAGWLCVAPAAAKTRHAPCTAPAYCLSHCPCRTAITAFMHGWRAWPPPMAPRPSPPSPSTQWPPPPRSQVCQVAPSCVAHADGPGCPGAVAGLPACWPSRLTVTCTLSCCVCRARPPTPPPALPSSPAGAPDPLHQGSTVAVQFSASEEGASFFCG